MTNPVAAGRKFRRSPKIPLLPEQINRQEPPIEAGLHGGASFSGAVFNLSSTIVGAGIMALPAAMKQLGLIPGLVMIVVGSTLTEWSIDFVLKFSRASKSVTYAGAVADSFGAAGRNLLQICIVVNNLGMLVVYMIIIGDVVSGSSANNVHHNGVMEEWFGQHWWTTRIFLLLFTTLLIFAPLISFKRVDSLRYTSALSVGLAIVFVAITACVAIAKLIDGSIGMPRLMPKLVDWASFWQLFTTVPILVTAYICHHNVHPIENELKDPTQMKSIVRVSLTICSSVYIATSIFGFLLFGDQTLDNVLANFDGDLGLPYSSLLDDIVRVSYGIHLMLVFPIVFYSLRLNVDSLLFPYAIPIVFDNRRFFSITIALMSFIFIGANFVPSIWYAFQLTGATAAISVGFIFPAALVLRDTCGIASKKDKLIAWLMFLLAISSSMAAISSDIYSTYVVEKRD